MMNDCWVVTDNRTGLVICYCGEEQDAIRMILFDHNRVYRKQKFIMDHVIDVFSTTDKQLPGQQGLPFGKIEQLSPQTIKLPEGQQEPVMVYNQSRN